MNYITGIILIILSPIGLIYFALIFIFKVICHPEAIILEGYNLDVISNNKNF